MSSDHWAIMMSINIVVKTGSNEKSHCLVLTAVMERGD